MNSINIRYGAILFLCFIGVYLFCRGFFLHRNLSTKVSSCDDLSSFYHLSRSRGDCWGGRRYNRTVILVVDALKYEFTTQLDDGFAYYANRMPIFEELKARHPMNTFHSKFVADSPTTTLQRLTALLTGSMPTFIDAATNFYQSSIIEDNLVKQMSLNGMKMVFMGDDTWMSLVPDKFLRSYPFPSFEVKDLHTVDNGIISHIYDELEAGRFDVLIAHFLGVDHCGHWYHQNHPQMATKLSQMNDVIHNVTSYLNEGDLLVVFGDHGMTLSGDHGGNTDEERNAALFMYAAKAPKEAPLLKQLAFEESQVSQIDLVPSLSILLGIPIPFSSLGYLIEPLFLSKPVQGPELVSLWINVQQVQQYVNSSSHLLKQIPHKVHHLNRLWDVLSANFNDSHSATSLHRAATNYLVQVQAMARSAFTVFNIPFMGLGVLHLTLAAIIAVYASRKEAITSSDTPEPTETLLYKWAAVAVTVVFSFGHFSNSFVIHEDSASLYLTQAVLLLVLTANRRRWKNILAVGTIMVFLRLLSSDGWICRYEQGCEDIQEDIAPWRMYLAGACVIGLVILFVKHIRESFGSSYTWSASAQIVSVLLYTGASSLVAYWFLQIQGEEKIRRLGNHQELLPNISFLCFLLLQITLSLHRRFAKDRVITRMDYVRLHAIAATLLLCIYTNQRHVPSLMILCACLLLVHLSKAIPQELEGVLALLLISNTFYSTGHQNTFQQLQWKVAFTGTAIGSASGSLLLPGLRVVLNTFSGHILVAFLLPSILHKGLPKSIFLTIQLIKLTSQCVACFVLRQHLMLWAVFATRLLFAVCEIFIILLFATVGAVMCRNSATWTLAHMGFMSNSEGQGKTKTHKH